jgi:excisionase family DNA binding protein
MRESHDPTNGGTQSPVYGHAPLAEPLLDAVAAARLLSVKPSWIYEAVRDGRLPHIKIGRHIRFLRSDLEDWILSRRVGGTFPTLARPHD